MAECDRNAGQVVPKIDPSARDFESRICEMKSQDDAESAINQYRAVEAISKAYPRKKGRRKERNKIVEKKKKMKRRRKAFSDEEEDDKNLKRTGVFAGIFRLSWL